MRARIDHFCDVLFYRTYVLMGNKDFNITVLTMAKANVSDSL